MSRVGRATCGSRTTMAGIQSLAEPPTDPSRLTLRMNWAQIQLCRSALLRIFSSERLFGIGVHALRIASGEDRGGPRIGATARHGLRTRNWHGIDRAGAIYADPDPDPHGYADSHADADTIAVAKSHAHADRDHDQ